MLTLYPKHNAFMISGKSNINLPPNEEIELIESLQAHELISLSAVKAEGEEQYRKLNTNYKEHYE